MASIRTKYHDFEEFRAAEQSRTPSRHTAGQLMRMYRAAKELESPVILELGTARGESTTVFLQACHERGGRLVSVDVEDCSDVSDSDRWTFVKSDSTNVPFIVANASILEQGIDILYVDSLHQRDHVEKELMRWYPYLNEGANIFLDDVDSHPYRRGNRKDNVRAEIAFDEIRELVQGFFYANEDDLSLEIVFGSTGLAHMRKLSPRGTAPQPARQLTHRRNTLTTILVDYPRLLAKWRRRGKAQT